MKISKITVQNFKAIDRATLELADFNVLVGANGSGKSSVLQAMHWVFQSGRNRSVSANRESTDGATLSENDATYMPSPEYRNSGNGAEYGNFQNSPKLDLKVEAKDTNGVSISADLWIKSARNEGISVHIPSGNALTNVIRDRRREISAYIPGLSGIPLLEEKRTKLIVERLAAAGDANTVLRNVLDLLKAKETDGKTGLETVQDYVSRVMGKLTLKVDFDEDQHSRILAQFQTAEMAVADPRRFKPLELAGIGFLQVIQIFSYLVYFRPVLLLVDEPDSHLHPTAQEKLISVLCEAARDFGTQIVLATHSPSVVRSLPADTKVIWMKDGAVQPNGDVAARNLMGWGLLDKRILLMTEDTGSAMLQSILSQWPDLERTTAIWPFHGTGKLPTPETINGLKGLFGDSIEIVIHRDRDFLMPGEVVALATPYQDKGFHFWVTKCSDMEAYWGEQSIIEAHFGVSGEAAADILTEAVNAACAENKALEKRRTKRNDASQKIPEARRGQLPQFGDVEVEAAATEHGDQHKVLGKDLVSAIRKSAQDKGLPRASSFGKSVPPDLDQVLVDELRETLEALL
jgi:AAA15 family ATPase/GTPase